jgi:hypothetical protein
MNDHTPSIHHAQLPREEWREVRGFEGRYEVSNYGHVRSLIDSKGRTRPLPFCLSSKLTGASYFQYNLYKKGALKQCLAHRLVLEAFVGQSDLHVNHIDGNKTNNFIGNLEYVTQTENMQHAIHVLGRRIGNKPGEGTPNHKLSDLQVTEILELAKRGLSQAEIARRFGIHQSHVSLLVHGKRRNC